ncbi:hypothetical protein Nepgr_033902 [Nepenthes gracilis]|uniref:Uncharacterized protein n=1 Tax=Nepenthes gracilis TaxID=150966 RepID=A0AAD3TLH2_NEPGR|nr:hypothetical protein Nepgr_033902 [Nepenthes gracilis]
MPSPDSGGQQSNFIEAKKMASRPGDGDSGAFYNGGKGWMAGEVKGSERRAGWEESWNGGGPWGREGLITYLEEQSMPAPSERRRPKPPARERRSKFEI